ncbi:MAG: glycosyltransferase family 2 protein [Methanoregula sp.]
MISIIIPLYNEAENVMMYEQRLFPVAEEIAQKFKEPCEFVLVDDGSKDSTLIRLNELQQKRNSVTVVAHGINKGMGAAIKTGIANSHGNLIITMDSDLTYKPEDIEKLLSSFRDSSADCISGSPYLEHGLTDELSAPHRLIMSKTVNQLYKILLGRNISCVSGIFRLYKKEVLEHMTIESNNFEINAEIISKLILGGKTVKEVAVELHKREFGESKINVNKEIKNNIRMLYKIFKTRYLKREWQ